MFGSRERSRWCRSRTQASSARSDLEVQQRRRTAAMSSAGSCRPRRRPSASEAGQALFDLDRTSTLTRSASCSPRTRFSRCRPGRNETVLDALVPAGNPRAAEDVAAGAGCHLNEYRVGVSRGPAAGRQDSADARARSGRTSALSTVVTPRAIAPARCKNGTKSSPHHAADIANRPPVIWGLHGLSAPARVARGLQLRHDG